MLSPWLRYLNVNSSSKNSLFGSAKKSKIDDSNKYKYSGFDYSWEFSFRDGGMGKNIITFEGDMDSSLHIDNENKDI